MTKTIDQALGRRLKILRVSQGMNQKALAEELGVSYQQVQKYESGKDKISISRLLDIAELFGVAPSTFLDDSDWQNDKILDRQVLNMMNYYSQIESEGSRKAILDIVKIVFESEKTN